MENLMDLEESATNMVTTILACIKTTLEMVTVNWLGQMV